MPLTESSKKVKEEEPCKPGDLMHTGKPVVLRADRLVLYGRAYTVEDMPDMMIRNGFLACTEYIDGVISMSACMDQALWLKTLIHEVTHVAQNESGKDSSEDEANWVATMVHDLLVNNPDIALAYAALGGAIELEEGTDEDDDDA